MKLESLLYYNSIADQDAAVNMPLGLALTARHVLEDLVYLAKKDFGTNLIVLGCYMQPPTRGNGAERRNMGRNIIT